mmetsp:Transcript_34172/g.69193  ORF Transcript_34172/g.69193 Transcript_34172/m.69193 type:complete len:127 (-) Transcript_34172:45-425(-)
MDDLERTVSALRRDGRKLRNEELHCSVQASFEAIEALQTFSVANYLIIRNVCESLEASIGFNTEDFLTQFVNTKRFVRDVEGETAGYQQLLKINIDLAQLATAVGNRRANSSLLRRIVAPMRTRRA